MSVRAAYIGDGELGLPDSGKFPRIPPALLKDATLVAAASARITGLPAGLGDIEVLDETEIRVPLDRLLGGVDAASAKRGVAAKLNLGELMALLEIITRIKELLEMLRGGRGAEPGPVPTPTPEPPAPAPERDEGQEAWVESIWTPWGETGETLIEGAELAPYLAGEKIVPGGSTIRFMTGILPQPSWKPDVPAGARAPFVVHHQWRYDSDRSYSLASNTSEASKPKFEIFGKPSGGAGIQMGDRWRDGDGWDVTVTLAEFDEGPRTLAYWTVRRGGMVSNVVRLKIAGRRQP